MNDMDKKIKLLFDANIIRDGDIDNIHRRGIYWVAYNLLSKFKEDERFDVTLYLYTNTKKDVLEDNPICKGLNCVFSNYRLGDSFNNKLIVNTKFNPKDYDVYFNVDFRIKMPNPDYEMLRFFVLHDTIPCIYPEFFNDRMKLSFQQLYEDLPKNVHYFCVSKSAKQDFIKYFPNMNPANMEVVYIAGGQNYYPQKDKEKLNRILDKYNVTAEKRKKYLFNFCGLGDPRKNLLFTVKSFIKFLEKYKIEDLYLYLGGSNTKEFLEQLKENVGDSFDYYKSKIVTLGYVEDEDINTLLNNSLFFVCLSLYEGFGMPTLEAMMTQTAVISSNTSSIPEVVGDCGILINPTNEDECIDAYYKLYFDEKLRTNYAQKAYERSKMFNWDKTYNTMANKILEVVNAR